MTAKTPQPIDVELDAPMTTDTTSGWACVSVSGSAERFGTGKAIKVAGTADGHPHQATMLPAGGGTHMLPSRPPSARPSARTSATMSPST